MLLWRIFIVLLVGISCLPVGTSQAAVLRLEVKSRADLLSGKSFGSTGPYEKLLGKIYFAVDPANPRNSSIADLDKAPRNRIGQVEFASDFYILKPKNMKRGNGVLLFEVSNRGGKGMLSFFNRANGSYDPASENELGDGFLMRQGYTLVWLGWQFDVPRQEGLMRLYAPVATNQGKPITGLVRSDFVLPERRYDASLADRQHVAYPVFDPSSPINQMTVRDTVLGQRETIPRQLWEFARWENEKAVPDDTRVCLKNGFEPGRIYEVVYQAQHPTVVGLGLAAVRDMISYCKYQPHAVVSLPLAYGFGISQSGRFLRHFLYQGFNADEHGRQVFDAVLAHVAGGGRGSFNYRFAQPSRDAHPFSAFFYPTDIFPFSDMAQTDPETGIRDGLLARAARDKVLPKIFYTNSSYEYWGRAASLIHTTVDGKADFPLMDNVRVYTFAGSQHGPGPFPPVYSSDKNYLGQQKINPNDFKWLMRALLLALDRWVKAGVPAPTSQYPTIAGKTLISLEEVRFPRIPELNFPLRLHEAYRVNYGNEFIRGIIDKEPPEVGKPFPMLVPQVDDDGNELAGIRTPEVAVPLATYTGWNLRDPRIGAPNELAGMAGSYIPLPWNRDEREKSRDPRLSIQERYSNREHYLEISRQAAMKLIDQRYLLAEDLPSVMRRAAEHWDYLSRNHP